ncbi:YkgJ family cysteine cluster protein [Acidicapsa acidisoli]|uniref:YkgJ family cysteine cluster protein n=1 Tax=Acidicapsa acidisoli TaxID=1615681 RepID=UPI0021DF4459|nr:YkgJ family cysteine cluster protein [Acidicapsa acidisoli]
MHQPFANPTVHLRQQDAKLIQIVDAALADATLRAGAHLACRPGCTQCCHGAFAINPLDALRLRSAMASMAETQPEQAAAIAARAQKFLTEFAPDFPGDPVTGILGTSPEEEAAFEDFANEAPCPALNPETGLCDLYEARPMTCRVFGPPVRMAASSDGEQQESSNAGNEDGFAICELCFTTATPEEIAAAEMTIPHAEEQTLLDQFDPVAKGETIVAYCLVPVPLSQPDATAA